MQNRTLEQQSEELYMAERRLELARAATNFGIWEWNIDTGELKWDAHMMEMYQPKDWKGKVSDFFNSLHPDDVETVRKALDLAVAGNGYNYRFRIITKDGEIRTIHGKGESLRRG